MAEGHAASAMCDEHSSGKARGRAPPSLSSGRFSARVRHFFVADGLDPNTLSCHVSRRRGAQQLRRAVKHRSKARRTSRRSKDDSRLTAFTASSSVSTMKPLTPSTGVPHAMASIITSPKGSDQSIGNTRRGTGKEILLGPIIDLAGLLLRNSSAKTD
jgi:hypothetical protein